MKTRHDESAIWAIDPFSKDMRPLIKAREALAAWEKSHPLAVQPVSLVTPPDLRWPVEFISPWGEAYSRFAEDAVKPLLKSLPMKNLLKPNVLLNAGLSRGESIDQLLKYARKSRARVIVVSTHVKKGIARFRLGGFTQSLIERSHVPVLTVRPDSKVPKKFSRILFMTDFSEASARGYRRLLDLAAEFGSRVILFHRLSFPEIPPFEYPGGMSGQDLHVMIEGYERRMQIMAEQWKTKGEKKGVKVESILALDARALSQSVSLAARRSRADLIALSLEPHPVTRALLGSSSSEIVQSAPKPVLVFRAGAGDSAH